METWHSIVETLRRAKTVLVSTHISPDPDAIGSSCALALGLESLGIDAQVYLAEELPRRFRNLAKSVRIVTSLPSPELSTVVSVDSATKRRVGPLADQFFTLAPVTINLDHHISNEKWATLNFIDAESSSSSEIVLELLNALNVNVTSEMANLLYSGLLDDTGSFRFSNANPGSFASAAKLISLGASPEAVSNALYYETPLKVLRLRALALTELELALNGKISVIVVTRDMLSRAGAHALDTEGLVDEARAVEGTLGAVLIRELEDGWKVSLRAKGNEFDANYVASLFGGGGHRAAAGATLRGKRDEIVKQLLDAIATQLSGHSQ